MDVTDAELSRIMSHALRHEPWLYEIEVDENGWTPVSQLVDALRNLGAQWAEVDRQRIERTIASATKQRHELSGDRIRAVYGHSLAGRISRTPARPPARLFHGTSADAWRLAAEEGLQPMGRQYVHLTVNPESAYQVGLRKSRKPVVLEIDSARAAHEGVAFFPGNDVVWLANNVPARFIKLVGG